MSQKVKEVFGFHVSRDRGTVRNPEDRTPIKVGTTYTATGRLKMCSVGCHASLDLFDAAKYRVLKENRIVSYVKVWGDVRIGEGKVCGRFRKVLATVKLDDVPVEECTLVHDGHTEKCGQMRVEYDFVRGIEKKLVASYKQNKRRVDADETLVVLPR